MRGTLISASILAAIAIVPLSSRPAQSPPPAIKFLPQIGGFSETEADFDEFLKPENWEQDPGAICELRRESLAASHASFAVFYSGDNEARRAALPVARLIQTRFA